MTTATVEVAVRRPAAVGSAGDVVTGASAPVPTAAVERRGTSGADRARGRLGRLVLHVAFIVTVLAAWTYASGRLLDELFLPKPAAVLASLTEGITSGYLWYHTQYTLTGLTIGFTLGAVVAFVTAVILAALPLRVGRFAEIYIIVFNGIPNIALVPVFIVWFGFGLPTKIVMGYLTVYFIVFIASYQALRNTDVRFLELARVLEANKWQTLTKFRLLAAVPFLASAFKLALPATALAVVTAEFIGSSRGLGYVLIRAGNLLNMPDLFAGVIVVAALVQVLSLVSGGVEHRLLTWVPKEKK